MTSRYNHLVQTGKVKPFDFQFQQCAGKRWHCISEPLAFHSIASRKRDAKEAVARQICDWYDEAQVADDADVPDPGFTVWVLVDADSSSNTLRNLARYENLEWLVVQGFANEVTSLPDDFPCHVYRSQGTLREAADHLLTWHTAQLVQTLGVPNCFIVVSRDAALQNTVQLIQQAGHKAVYCPRDLRGVKDVLEYV